MAQSFERWKRGVNTVLIDALNLDADMLVDVDYWRMWDSGWNYKRAAKAALRASDAPREVVGLVK
jgi:hypothetical protein